MADENTATQATNNLLSDLSLQRAELCSTMLSNIYTAMDGFDEDVEDGEDGRGDRDGTRRDWSVTLTFLPNEDGGDSWEIGVTQGNSPGVEPSLESGSGSAYQSTRPPVYGGVLRQYLSKHQARNCAEWIVIACDQYKSKSFHTSCQNPWSPRRQEGMVPTTFDVKDGEMYVSSQEKMTGGRVWTATLGLSVKP